VKVDVAEQANGAGEKVACGDDDAAAPGTVAGLDGGTNGGGGVLGTCAEFGDREVPVGERWRTNAAQD